MEDGERAGPAAGQQARLAAGGLVVSLPTLTFLIALANVRLGV